MTDSAVAAASLGPTRAHLNHVDEVRIHRTTELLQSTGTFIFI